MAVKSLQLKTFFCSPVLHVRVYKNSYSPDVCSQGTFCKCMWSAGQPGYFLSCPCRFAGLPAGSERQDGVGALPQRRRRSPLRRHRQEPRRRLLEKDSWECLTFNRQVGSAWQSVQSFGMSALSLLWALPDGAQAGHMQAEPHALCFSKGVFITLVKTFSGYDWENRSKYYLFCV